VAQKIEGFASQDSRYDNSYANLLKFYNFWDSLK